MVGQWISINELRESWNWTVNWCEMECSLTCRKSKRFWFGLKEREICRYLTNDSVVSFKSGIAWKST